MKVAGESQPFSPQHAQAESAQAEVQEVVQRSPRLWGLARSRWWLGGLRQVITWLNPLSLPGVQQLLQRLGIVYKRGRRYVHSPDPAYDHKLAQVVRAQRAARAKPAQIIFVYQDELTYYRHPTVARTYARTGKDGPYARQGLGYNTAYRIAGCLNLVSGQLFCWQRDHFDRQTLIRYYRDLATHYPQAQRIFVVQDNWPVHFHPDVLAALKQTPVRLLPLPTYAPWTNPIEKVWRKLYQEVLHLHDFALHWTDLKQLVADWLNQFNSPSPALLRYVGLYPN